jgi:hypothetical protein
LQFQCNYCGTTCGFLTNTTGTLAVTNYQNDAECQWLIAPSNVATVIVIFTSLNTQPEMDYVRVGSCWLPACQTLQEPKVLSGTYSTRQSYVATRGVVWVEFTSDSSITGAGFMASWTSVCCCNIALAFNIVLVAILVTCFVLSNSCIQTDV